uniref:Band 7 domain-containing protein n=1 Tax=Candidozyma auris TaxID=498019 RepID=A0A0L0P7B3_CANAR
MFPLSAKRNLLARVRLYSSTNGFKNQNPALSFFQRAKLPANTIIKFVPQQTAYVVERMGKFLKVLQPGIALLLPFLDRISYVHSLKETAIEIPSQNAITADNVSLELDGILYIKVHDPYKASYGVEDFKFAISQLAQTTMRSEIGSMSLDAVLKERQKLNTNINQIINEAAKDHWGVECLRYEIRDIHPPQNVVDAMHRQVSADRSKRADILESEGVRQSKINIAEGEKQAAILKAESTAVSIERIAKTIAEHSGENAVNLQIAQEYIKEFGNIAKTTNTVVIPSSMSDVSGFVASGLSVYDSIAKRTKNDL